MIEPGLVDELALDLRCDLGAGLVERQAHDFVRAAGAQQLRGPRQTQVTCICAITSATPPA